jgi:hypothetical protein
MFEDTSTATGLLDYRKMKTNYMGSSQAKTRGCVTKETSVWLLSTPMITVKNNK